MSRVSKMTREIRPGENVAVSCIPIIGPKPLKGWRAPDISGIVCD